MASLVGIIFGLVDGGGFDLGSLHPQRGGESASGVISRRGIVSPSNEELLQNTIAFFVPSILFFALRIINAAWVLRKMHVEDYIMCVTMFFYMSLLSLINVSARFNTNLFPPEQLETIMANPSDVHNRIIGSILVIPLEQCMLLSTWGVKTCIWLFLTRLCRQLPPFQLALRLLAIYIALGYITIQLVYYVGVCRPFKQYWAVPVRNSECATYHNYSIVQMAFNITSDIALIVIPCCMFWIARLPAKRRALLTGVFSLAIFTIIAAILNKVYNFLSPLTTTYQLWYIRESSVAIWVGNVICCWQLFQKVFKLRSFDGRHDGIVAQPEMAARGDNAVRVRNAVGAGNAGQFSNGGSPKTPAWYERALSRAIAAGNVMSTAAHRTRTMASQLDAGKTNSDHTGLTNETYIDEKRGAARFDETATAATIMSLRSGEDDAGPAIAYRNTHNIV